MEQNLQQVNLDRPWLNAQLRKLGFNDPSEIFMASLDTNGDLYVDAYKDRIKNITDISDYH
ncbi:MAG: hypothetical protein GX295_11390 [Syntrophomonadaceae bacterium]|nr:hypothetical protein [Syntrophomonadaceae bacterium]